MARNLTDASEGFLRDCHFLIHDRSALFSEQFRMILKSVGVEPVRLPARSPDLNAFAERFVRTIKESCLARILIMGEWSLRRAITEFVSHYHHDAQPSRPREQDYSTRIHRVSGDRDRPFSNPTRWHASLLL